MIGDYAASIVTAKDETSVFVVFSITNHPIRYMCLTKWKWLISILSKNAENLRYFL